MNHTDSWAFIAHSVLEDQQFWRERLRTPVEDTVLDFTPHEARALCLHHLRKLNQEFRKTLRMASQKYNCTYHEVLLFFRNNVEKIYEHNR